MIKKLIMSRQEKMGIGFLKGQRGVSLMETLIALALVGIISLAFVQALTTISMSTGSHEDWITAANLAQSQVEEIKAAAYSPIGYYPVAVTLPLRYNISISPQEVAAGKQEITVTVSKDGDNSFTLSIIKINW